MHRRAYWRALMAAGMGPLAGGGVFEATTEEDDPAAAREEQVAAANDHLKQIFDTLAEYDIVADGRPAVDPDAYASEDLGVLRQELEGAQTAVAELDELGREAETPAPSSEVVRGGTLLASVRVEMYGRARELAGQDRAAHAALGEQNFERVQTVARGVPATAGDVASAAQECGDLIATFRSESFSAPSFYRLEQANQEHEAFSEIAATVDPAAGGVASVGRALSRGAAGRELLASDQYDTAEIAYEEALGAIDAARQQFARLGGPPPMFEAAVERGRCGLDQLSEAYSAAREGIQAARKGDSDQADKRLATAEDRLETYLADCLEA